MVSSLVLLGFSVPCHSLVGRARPGTDVRMEAQPGQSMTVPLYLEESPDRSDERVLAWEHILLQNRCERDWRRQCRACPEARHPRTTPLTDAPTTFDSGAGLTRAVDDPLDQVGCPASLSMRAMICPKSLCVKWLSASCRMKYLACLMRRPPVLNSRCCRRASRGTGSSGSYPSAPTGTASLPARAATGSSRRTARSRRSGSATSERTPRPSPCPNRS